MRLNYLFYVFITMILGILFVTQSYLILFLFLGVIILANIRHLNRDIVVFIVVALTPLERVIPFFTLTLPQILMIKYFVLIFLMLFWLLKEKNVCFPVKDRKYINYWIGAFFSLIFLSTVNSINIFESIKGTLPIATGFIAFLFFYNYFKSEIELRKVMYLFLLITFIVSLIACLQLIIIKFNVLNFLESFILPPRLRAFSRMKYMSEMPDLIRISGTFYHPNLFGSFLNYMFFFSILVLMQKKLSKLWRLIAISSTVLTVISIYGTNSRSTILGILCGLTFILFWKKRKLFIWGLLVSILFSSTLLFTGLLNENIEDSVHSGRGISYRDIIWKNAFGIILESPILGYGINTYPYVHSQNIGLPLGDSKEAYIENLMSINRLGYIPEVIPGININPHNTFLAIMLDMGILGLFLIIAFYVYFIKINIKLITYSKNKDIDIIFCTAISLFGILVATIVKSMFEFSLFYKTSYDSVLLSMIVSLLIVMKEKLEIGDGKLV